MRHRFIQDLYGRSFDSPASLRSHVDIGSRRCEVGSWADGHCVGREWTTIFARKRNGVDIFVGAIRHRVRLSMGAAVL